MNMPVFQILLTLTESSRDASGMLEALAELDDRGRQPSMASLYRNLKRAVEQEWLEIVDEGSQPRAAGRPGQVYRITDRGTTAVRAEAVRLKDLAARALSRDSVPKAESADV